MSLETEIEILRMIDLFSDFDHDQLNLIAFTSKKLKYPPEVEIFHEGQAASGGYAVMEGSVNLLRKRNDQSEHVGKLGVGGLLSELSLITPNRRRVTAVADTEALLLSIPRSVMLRILNGYPHLAASIRSKIHKSITSMVHDMENVPAKLNRSQTSQ